MHFLFGFLLSAISLFLILLVLVQRGRGGGLTGALGGMGGQSAFGTKAGDTFTRVTVIAAAIWILVSILAVKSLSTAGGPLGDASAAAPPAEKAAAGATDSGAADSVLDNLPNISGAAATAGGDAGATDGAATAEAEPTGE